MRITFLKRELAGECAALAAEAFAEDAFYAGLSADKAIRIAKLREIFIDSIEGMCESGIALTAELEGSLAGIMLAFDFNRLKAENRTLFDAVFGLGDKGGKELSEKLKSEYVEIEKLTEKGEFIYVLSVAVKSGCRRRGVASALLRAVTDAYPAHNLFADVSNPAAYPMYERAGFKRKGDGEGCAFFVRYSAQEDVLAALDFSEITLCVPAGLDCAAFFGRKIKSGKRVIRGVSAGEAAFSACPGCESEAAAIEIKYPELLKYQRAIGLEHCVECVSEDGGKPALYYISERPGAVCFSKEGMEKYAERDTVADVFLSVPVNYEKRTEGLARPASLFAARVISALEFRTLYESGFPGRESKGIKSRIKRICLGSADLRLMAERELRFSGEKLPREFIGLPASCQLIFTFDKFTRNGVLTLCIPSSPFILSQLLDSMSRNELTVWENGKTRNFYEYIKSEFGLIKRGSAKAFITLPQEKGKLDKNIAGSLLYCETAYAENQALGKVVDPAIISQTEGELGVSQYDYACLYTYSNILLQSSERMMRSVSERICLQSVTLYYIETVLFDEASLNTVNDQIKKFLADIDSYGPHQVMRTVNAIISENVKSMDFWNVEMNYPSSRVSARLIRQSFGVDALVEEVERNKRQLETIYGSRSDLVDKKESALLSAVGATLTVLSVIELIFDKSKALPLIIAALLIGGLLLFKKLSYRFSFRSGRKRAKEINRKADSRGTGGDPRR